MWAAGIILYTLLTGAHPFYKEGDTIEQFAAKMLNPRFTFPKNTSA